jgi:trehalose-phosphatase
MPSPKYLFKNWSTIRSRGLRARRRFLLLDFDGTLAPIRPRPEQARLSKSVTRLLRSIHRHSSVRLAVISGRGLQDLRRKVGVRGIWYAGTHGYALTTPRGKRISALSAAQRASVTKALRELRAGLKGLRGIQLEPKEATVAVHYRRADRNAELAARQVVRDTLAAHSNLKLLEGKKIWELVPRANVDKWTAARTILRKEGWSSSRDLVFFFGDDVTDEAIFRGMRGISVAVGKQRGTAAKYFLRSPKEVEQFLERWDDLVGAHSASR